MIAPVAPAVGALSWVDLPVPDAEAIRDSCARGVGWRVGEVEMGGYQDHGMNEPAGAAKAGGR